ncbi:MAG: hypothetical protein KA780_11660 [Prolixibacteraceae bacterium]|nr:hypothetical protein [Prolixibacteraceae bacterium]NLX28157.1 hypothetical protein [Bacteroidales bacterium]
MHIKNTSIHIPHPSGTLFVVNHVKTLTENITF